MLFCFLAISFNVRDSAGAKIPIVKRCSMTIPGRDYDDGVLQTAVAIAFALDSTANGTNREIGSWRPQCRLALFETLQPPNSTRFGSLLESGVVGQLNLGRREVPGRSTLAFKHLCVASMRPKPPHSSQPLGGPNLPLVHSKVVRDFVPERLLYQAFQILPVAN